LTALEKSRSPVINEVRIRSDCTGKEFCVFLIPWECELDRIANEDCERVEHGIPTV
jgi:hypothetical protein